MTLRARLELEDSFARERACTICGQTALSVVHLKGFPDYVTCAGCGAAFVMEEGGERAMFGSIPPEYPETRDFALKQWTSLEAIAALAEAERPHSPSDHGSRADTPAAVAVAEPTPEIDPAVTPEPVDEPFERPAPAATVEPAAAPAPALEAFEWPAPAAEAEPAPAPEPGLEAFDWPAPAAEAEPAPAPEPAPEAFEWPAPAAEAEPAAAPEPALQAFEWPAPAAEAEPAPAPEPPLDPFTWPAASLAAESTPEPHRPPEPGAFIRPPTADARPPEPAPVVTPEPAPKVTLEPASSEEMLEPPVGRRFRVRYLGAQARIPAESCSHCLRTPARRTLVIAGVALGPGGQPRRATFTLPLCSSCYRRARARSDEERNSRLTGHLISALIGAVVMVGALALRLVTFAAAPLVDAALLLVLGLCGYGIPALLLLGRSGRMPPPEDALFVRSTLLVSAQPGAGESLFDWRNPGTASRFQEANPGETGDTIFEIADPLARPESSHHEPEA